MRSPYDTPQRPALRRRDSDWVGGFMRFSTYAFLLVCLWVDVSLVRNAGFNETSIPHLMATCLFEIELYLGMVVVVMTLHLMTTPPLDRGPRRAKRKAKKARASAPY